MNLNDYLKLYLILETSMLRLPLGDFIIQAIEGGVTAIQLRDKTENARERYETAKALKSLIADKDVLFIINNNADLAICAGAHGVHLGIEDMPPQAVKKAFPELITGYSCNNPDDCTLAISAKVDYTGIGPVYFTPTKTNLRPVLGVQGVSDLAAALPMPKVAIGGINSENIGELAGSKVSGVAVSSALCQSEMPYDEAVNMRKMVEKYERV